MNYRILLNMADSTPRVRPTQFHKQIKVTQVFHRSRALILNISKWHIVKENILYPTSLVKQKFLAIMYTVFKSNISLIDYSVISAQTSMLNTVPWLLRWPTFVSTWHKTIWHPVWVTPPEWCTCWPWRQWDPPPLRVSPESPALTDSAALPLTTQTLVLHLHPVTSTLAEPTYAVFPFHITWHSYVLNIVSSWHQSKCRLQILEKKKKVVVNDCLVI